MEILFALDVMSWEKESEHEKSTRILDQHRLPRTSTSGLTHSLGGPVVSASVHALMSIRSTINNQRKKELMISAQGVGLLPYHEAVKSTAIMVNALDLRLGIECARRSQAFSNIRCR